MRVSVIRDPCLTPRQRRVVAAARLGTLLRSCGEQLEVPVRATLCVRLTSDAELQDLNARFLGNDTLGVERSMLGANAAAAANLPYQPAVLLHNAGDGLLNLGEVARARETLSRSRELTSKHGYELLDVYNRALLAFIDLL